MVTGTEQILRYEVETMYRFATKRILKSFYEEHERHVLTEVQRIF